MIATFEGFSEEYKAGWQSYMNGEKLDEDAASDEFKSGWWDAYDVCFRNEE